MAGPLPLLPPRRGRAVTAFPGHAGRSWALLGWRLVARDRTLGRSPVKILVAGIGNIFFGDDGFGVEVASRLAGRALPAGVRLGDYGIRGVHLAYELLDGYDALVLDRRRADGRAAGHGGGHRGRHGRRGERGRRRRSTPTR